LIIVRIFFHFTTTNTWWVHEIISEHSRKGYWGTGAIASISEQLQRELPGLRGFGERQLKNMRTFYEEWSNYFKSVATAAEILEDENQGDEFFFDIAKYKSVAIGERFDV